MMDDEEFIDGQMANEQNIQSTSSITSKKSTKQMANNQFNLDQTNQQENLHSIDGTRQEHRCSKDNVSDMDSKQVNNFEQQLQQPECSSPCTSTMLVLASSCSSTQSVLSSSPSACMKINSQYKQSTNGHVLYDDNDFVVDNDDGSNRSVLAIQTQCHDHQDDHHCKQIQYHHHHHHHYHNPHNDSSIFHSDDQLKFDQLNSKASANSNRSLNINANHVNNNKSEERKRLKQQRRLARRMQQTRNRTYWNAMPVDIMERIFSLLTIKERHLASQVCPHWFECFYCPTIWTSLVVTDRSFTKRKFNYYLGYQRIIDPFKTQTYLLKFGHNLRQLIIRPMSNFFNLFEFMKILSQFAQHYEPNQLRHLYRFDFTFCCLQPKSSFNDGFADLNQVPIAAFGDRDVIGTGGKILEALKELMFYLIGLKHLALRDLLLNVDEAQTLLDNVAHNCYEQLRTLTLINCCKNQCAFLHTGIFINLETLIISCQHLDENVLMLLAYNEHLSDLYIVQTEVTRTQGPLARSIWNRFTKENMHTKIHLVMVNRTNYCQNPLTYELALQQTRVTSIIYDMATIRPVYGRLIEIGQLYSQSLQCLEFYNIPKFSIRKSYADRVDTLLIYLSEQCPKLRTIIINDLISTATLLLIVSHTRNLSKLLVRRNAIRKRFDCIINPEWQDNYVNWLKITSRSYDLTFMEVSRMLGYKWLPLSDEQFKRIKPNVRF